MNYHIEGILESGQCFGKDMEIMKVELLICSGTRFSGPIDFEILWVNVMVNKGGPNIFDTSNFLRPEVFHR